MAPIWEGSPGGLLSVPPAKGRVVPSPLGSTRPSWRNSSEPSELPRAPAALGAGGAPRVTAAELEISAGREGGKKLRRRPRRSVFQTGGGRLGLGRKR